jgi:hypothetical protein
VYNEDGVSLRSGDVQLEEFRLFRSYCSDEYIYDQIAKEADSGKV